MAATKRTSKREKRLEIMSANLRYLREQKFPGRGGSKKCADALGMKQQQWSPWEKGQRMPTDDSLRKIAAYFGVTVDYLKTDHPEGHTAQDGNVAVPSSIPKHSNETAENASSSHTADIVREITDDIRSQVLARLLNIKATLKLELSVVDVDLRM